MIVTLMPYYFVFCDETFSKDFAFCPSFRCFLWQLRPHWLFPSWLKVKVPHREKCVVENSLTFSISKLSPELTLYLVSLRETNIDEVITCKGKRTYFIDYLLSKPKAIYTSMHFVCYYMLGSRFCTWCTNFKIECMPKHAILKNRN